MNQTIETLLTTLKIQPVLVDIGASGAPPPQWAAIARHSIYVGFDPDRRELHDVPSGQYARSIIVNEAVTNTLEPCNIHFYLTRSPYCSSTLLPDKSSLANYLFSDLFVVEAEVSVRATSLNAVIDGLHLPGVHWFKADSQGMDLRLFQSLRSDLREKVLAVDIEPGLVDAYRGEDLFIDVHRELQQQGFWLSTLNVEGTVRLRRSTFDVVARNHPELTEKHVHKTVRPSPVWCTARYLRTIESLDARAAEPWEYALLWVFTLVERQIGFALDVALAYEQRFGEDSLSLFLRNVPLQELDRKHATSPWRSIARRVIPKSLRRQIKQVLYNES